MAEVRCKSPICVVVDGVRGRMFTPPESSLGMSQVWCQNCLRLASQMQYFSHETAEMVRNTYKEYMHTELPREVKLILEQFAREILRNLNEEL